MVWLRRLSIAVAATIICQTAIGETLLLEFTTQSCGPCRQMRPVMQQLAAEGYAVREIDATSHPQAVADYRVSGFPTFVVLVNQREYARLEGSTDHRTLVDMVHRATAIAAQQAQQPSAQGPPVSFVNSAAPAANPFANVPQPMPGRVTQIGSPEATPQATPATASAAAANPFGNASATSYGPPPVQNQPPTASANPANQAGGTSASAKLVDSTVRLSIADAEGKSTGTGTIIDARMGKALILTCGHLFRESKGQGVVDVTLFRAGANGAEPIGSAQAQLIDYDLERDLAVLCFETSSQVAVTPLAPRGTPLSVSAPAISVGCGHGANPTPWETSITAVNRYQGHPNVEAARAPEEGRSGGGLFNAEGRLIGVCYAADPQGNEGLYASLDSIYQKLDALNLTATLQAAPQDAPQQLAAVPQTPPSAAAPAPFEVRGQSSTTPPAPSAASPANPFASNAPAASADAGSSAHAFTAVDDAPMPSAAALPPEERAAIQEIGRRAGNSEVIVIIRPHDATSPSDVIKLKTASPEFVRTLEAAAKAPAAGMATQPGATLTR